LKQFFYLTQICYVLPITSSNLFGVLLFKDEEVINFGKQS